MPHGSPYQTERMAISQVKLTTRNVTGYYSTMLPTTWMNNQSRVLCAYSESVLRVGSLVYIKSNAPVSMLLVPILCTLIFIMIPTVIINLGMLLPTSIHLYY